MDIKSILEVYDGLFGNTILAEIESYLYQSICEPISEQYAEEEILSSEAQPNYHGCASLKYNLFVSKLRKN